MNAIQIGPLVFDGARFAGIFAMLAFLVTAEVLARLDRRRGGTGEAARWAGYAMFAWIIGARIGFIASNWPEFAAHPLDMMKVWQGGFDANSGWLAGAAVVLLALLKRRKGVAGPLVWAGALAFVAQIGITLMQPRSEMALPPMDLLTLSGGSEQLAGRGKPVVLNLWATWCPPCRREMPMMVDLAAKNPDVDFVFANQGEEPDRIRSFLQDTDLPEDGMLRDPKQRLMDQMGAIGLPTTMVFDADGKLVVAQMGEVSRATLTDMIAQANGE